MKPGFLKNLAVPILFTLLLVLPQAVLLHRMPQSSRFFCDEDELLYLKQSAFFAGSQDLSALYKEHEQPQNLRELLTIPHDVSSLAAGWGIQRLSLSLQEASFILDLVCIFLSLLAFRAFWGCLARKRATAEMLSFVILGAPWTLSILFGNYSGSFTFWTVGDSCLPVERAVNTQLVYPVFGFCLYLLTRAAKNGFSGKSLFTAGGLGGAAIYLYFFGWGVIGAAGALFLLLSAPLPSIKEGLRRLAPFCLGFVIVSLPGLWLMITSMLLSGALSAGTAAADLTLHQAREQYFAPLSVFVTLAILAAVFAVVKRRFRLIGAWMLAAGLAEVFLVNMQPLLNVFLQPIHFALFFLYPMLGALLVALVAEYLSSVKGLRNIVYAVLSVMIVLVSAGRAIRVPATVDAQNVFAADVRARGIEKKTFAFYPYRKHEASGSGRWNARLEPYFWGALTGNYIVLQEIFSMRLVSQREQVERQLLLNWLYTGNLQLFISCGRDVVDPVPNNYFQQWIFEANMMKQLCRLYEREARGMDVCTLIKKFHVEYIVEEEGLPQFAHWDVYQPQLLGEWGAVGDEIRAYEIDWDSFTTRICAEKRGGRGLPE